MTYGRYLERHLKYFGHVGDGGKAITFSEWATLAQDCADWLLAEARHESAFRHWETAAAITLVRHQSYTKGEAEVPGAACPGD
jgi:hemolysin-activating ACP:hemolysin acyltransferase